MSKTYSQTYLFKQYSEYEKKMYVFIMTADRIDVGSKEFEDVLYDFKRRNVNSNLLKISSLSSILFLHIKYFPTIINLACSVAP